MTEYIVVRNWEKFQHYKDRNPPWIKLYVGLHQDPAWVGLSANRRAILVGIWMVAAGVSRSDVVVNDSNSTRDRVVVESSPTGRHSLGKILRTRVTENDIKALVRAGFLRIDASIALASRYQDASGSRARAEGEKYEDINLGSSLDDLGIRSETVSPPDLRNGKLDEPSKLTQEEREANKQWLANIDLTKEMP